MFSPSEVIYTEHLSLSAKRRTKLVPLFLGTKPIPCINFCLQESWMATRLPRTCKSAIGYIRWSLDSRHVFTQTITPSYYRMYIPSSKVQIVP